MENSGTEPSSGSDPLPLRELPHIKDTPAADWGLTPNSVSVPEFGYFFAPPEAGWKTWLLNVA
jgi:hypothetical protein